MNNGNTDKERRRKIIRGETIIDPCGFPSTPIKMGLFDEWTESKIAIMIRQTTMPFQYAAMPYLQAIFAMDADAGFQFGIVRNLVRLLSMASLLPETGFNVWLSKKEPNRINAISYSEGDVSFRIEPKDFQRIRQLIAEQNGEELPDESENPELVEAESDIAAAKSIGIEYDYETMLDSVAYVTHRTKPELMDISIREFARLRKAIDRDKLFTLYASAELGGMVKFEKGNPVPSWCFDKKSESSALTPLSNFMQRIGANSSL